MNSSVQEDVFHSFQLPYLQALESNGSACTGDLNTAAWLAANFGRFGHFARYQDFLSLNARFNAWDVLGNLTVKQLAQLSASAGALRTPRDAETIMSLIETSTLTEFVDEFNRQDNVSLTIEIRASLLSRVLTLAQPIFEKADDAEFLIWTEQRLPGLVPGMNASDVRLLFDHLEDRNCPAINATVTLLNASIGDFSNVTRQSIYKAILTFNSNSSLRCYAANTSFSVFLEEMFQGFANFLTLRDLGTLIPASNLQKIVNTIPPDAVSDLFARNGFLNDDPFLTVWLQLYERSGLFIDRFNQKNVTDLLSNGTKVALLAGVWPSLVSSDNNETEVERWLEGRLDNYFMFLNGDVLNASKTLNASCGTYSKIVNKLNENIALFEGREEEMYFSIKAYLTATEEKPRCYNISDRGMSNWLAMYFRSYIRFSSARDMRLLTNHSASIFQDLAFNRDNLELIYRYPIRDDLAEMYADAILTVASDFNLNSLPNQLLCFARRSTMISGLSPNEALDLVARVNLHCNSSQPSSSDRQLATMLVAQIKAFSSETLVALGQQAMGLTTGQIYNLTADVLKDPKALEALGRVKGWNRGQSQVLVSRILSNDFALDTPEKFQSLGTLAQGLPSTSFDRIPAGSAIELAKDAHFVSILRRGPEHLQKAFVSKILSNSSSFNDILNNVPDELVDQVPIPLLLSQGENPDLRKINEKQWSSQQAAILFGNVLSRTDNYTELSAFILQGFQCNAAGKLSAGQLSSLVREVKMKNANLSDGQLSCAARLLANHNLDANFTDYPPDVLLFFPLDQVDGANCERFYSLASQGDLSLLANGSAQRTRLLENALRCFGVGNSTALRKEHLQHLGAFVCDMDASVINDSDPEVLQNLKLCPELSNSQVMALNTRLSSGTPPYNAPESWNDSTLEDLGPLAFYINRSIWNRINGQERVAFFRSLSDAYDGQSAAQKEKTRLFLRTVGPNPASAARSKRATEECQSGPITASTLEDPLFIILYDSAGQFDACLDKEVLRGSLATLLEQPLPNDYLVVMKRKLDELYPSGVPEDQLRLLGFLAHQYNAEEIRRWNVTSSDTLAALLNPDNGAWDAAPLRELVARYIASGGTLSNPILDLLGGVYLCYLGEDQLQQINPEAIRNAEKLDISTCPQSKKDILYGKASTAFSPEEGTSPYYSLIQPYLGGASAEDLKKLARSQVDMDINTFLNLNPEELQALSVQDVRGLLGVNLPDLKGAEREPSVAGWIRRQYQSDLDTLRIGLTGGMPSPLPTGSSNDRVNASMTSSSNVSSDNTTGLLPLMPTDGTPLFEITDAATSPSIAPTNKTVTAIDVVPKVDLPTSSDVPVTSNETVNDVEDATDATTTDQPADSNSIAASASTINDTVVFPTEIPGTSFNVTEALNDTVGGTPSPVTGTDIEATTSGFDTSAANGTVIPPFTVEANATTSSNDTIGGLPVPLPTTGTSVENTTFANITDATNRTSFPPNVTTDTNATVMPTPSVFINHTSGANVTTTGADNVTSAMRNMTVPSSQIPPGLVDITDTNTTMSSTPAVNLNHTLSADATTAGADNVTSPKFGVTEISSQKPPVVVVPVPNATIPSSIGTTRGTTTVSPTTAKTTSRAPPRTRPPFRPTPNGLINVEPGNSLASNASLSWVLLTLSLVVGVSMPKRFL
nr:PREDICTED: uncharacterized protein LOC103281161 [Anolis carolinensis]|eukprot:XP_016853491.1 PREDICTED: uncharacterized protein LOC103281161 [Anolis carolinensis]